MSNRQEAKIQLLREHFFYFVQQVFRTVRPGEELVTGEYLEAMCFAAQRLCRQDGARAVINVPPRSLKSIVVSVALPLWDLGHNPSKEVIVATYNNDLSQELGRMCQAVTQTPWYQRTFPRMRVNPRANTATEILTTRNGGRRGVSVGGTVTGFGADLVIIDDISKAGDVFSEVERQRRKDFYDQSLHTRLNNPRTGKVIAIQQRLHEDDICGHLLSKGVFEHLVMPAIAEDDETWPLYFNRAWSRLRGEALCPERLNVNELRNLALQMNPYDYATQYQQTCTARGGNQIRWDDILTYDEVPSRPMFMRVVQSWDTAVTANQDSDYCVCTTWGYSVDKKWYLLDVYRARHEFSQLESAAIELKERWNPDAIVIELQGAGLPLCSKLRQRFYQGRPPRDGFRPFISPFNPKFDKEERFHLHKYKLEEQDFLFPVRAPWLSDFRHEFQTFPAGKYDDQVDSVIQFLAWLETPHARATMNERRRRLGRGR